MTLLLKTTLTREATRHELQTVGQDACKTSENVSPSTYWVAKGLRSSEAPHPLRFWARLGHRLSDVERHPREQMLVLLAVGKLPELAGRRWRHRRVAEVLQRWFSHLDRCNPVRQQSRYVALSSSAVVLARAMPEGSTVDGALLRQPHNCSRRSA